MRWFNRQAITLGPHLLGRTVEHDPRSLAYPAPHALPGETRTVWRHHGSVLDQGNLGSCTGNAMAQCLMTDPYRQTRRRLKEADALALYAKATQLDGFPGTYPPDDTGSSGLAVAKAAQQAGYITGYTHAFGIEHAKAALVYGPMIVGTNWYASMFTPDPRTGEVSIIGKPIGGHEYLLLGYLPAHTTGGADVYAFLNSWGHWGRGSHVIGTRTGVFTMTAATFSRLLSENGDLTQPVISADTTPQRKSCLFGMR